MLEHMKIQIVCIDTLKKDSNTMCNVNFFGAHGQSIPAFGLVQVEQLPHERANWTDWTNNMAEKWWHIEVGVGGRFDCCCFSCLLVTDLLDQHVTYAQLFWVENGKFTKQEFFRFIQFFPGFLGIYVGPFRSTLFLLTVKHTPFEPYLMVLQW